MSRIYQLLSELASAPVFGGVWRFVIPDADLRCLPRPILTGLRGAFTDDELEASGLLSRNGLGQVMISPTLRTRPHLLAVLRRNADALPHDILCPGGSVAGNAVPCLTAAEDAHTARGLRSWGKELLVAFDFRDTAILRGLGFPTTIASGLAQFDGSQLRRLLGRPRCLTQAATNSHIHGDVQRHELWNSVENLVLVGWSVVGLNDRKPRDLQAVATLFAAARDCFGFDTSRVTVWRPTKCQLETIQWAVRLRDVELARQAMAASMAGSLRAIEHFADKPAVPPREDFRLAWARLVAELRGEQERKILSIWTPKLLAAYNESFTRAFVEPLVDEAVSAVDPMEQSVLLVAAGLSQELHNRSPIVMGCSEHSSRTRVPGEVPMEPDLLKEYLQISARLIAIWRERKRGEQQ